MLHRVPTEDFPWLFLLRCTPHETLTGSALGYAQTGVEVTFVYGNKKRTRKPCNRRVFEMGILLERYYSPKDKILDAGKQSSPRWRRRNTTFKGSR